MTILSLVCNMGEYCIQMIILNFNKSDSTYFIFNNDPFSTRI